jgi:P4 family phage/plasmid primase-like protien
VPFDYDQEASQPKAWSDFLRALWPKEPAAIDALGEWFGYVISGRLDLHKILLNIGPTRGGKGVIARIETALIGRGNVAGPTLNSLGGEFGLAPLIGKPLAIISDARFVGKNSNIVVERLLSISGEDTLTVNRKYRDQWTGKLPSRLHVISNELPQLGDASTAIVGRIVLLPLSLSWLGKEDHSLELRLHAELPSILNWALDGLQRLTKNGNRFTRVASAEEAVTLMRDLASPVAAFVRERCVIGTDKQIEVQRLYSAYRAWCDENGHVKATKASFGRDLRAAIPSVKRRRLREEADDDRIYVYFGIDLAGGSDIGPALGPLGPEPTGRGADGSGPSGPRKSPMYAAPPGKGSHVPKSDDLPYDGPPVPVPNLGPDPLDEHGAPVAANFVTTIRTMLGDELIAKLQGTSLDRLDEYDALVVLNRGAEPGQLTPVVKGLIEDAIAGKDVSAWGVQKYGVQKTRDVEAEAKRPVATNGGNEPGLSVTRIRELRQCCLDHAEAQRRDTGEVDQAEIEEGLRIILREEVLPEFVEVELQRVMAAVFAA